MALRVQVAMIYFDSAIGKVFAADWVTGTTEYYLIRDPYFGAWGPVGTLLRFLSENALITVTMTWGAMVLETLIAVFIPCGPRARKFALLGCVALHGMIVLSIGLWSFGLIMIGGVTIASMGAKPAERRRAQLRQPTAASIASEPRESTRPMPHRSEPTTT